MRLVLLALVLGALAVPVAVFLALARAARLAALRAAGLRAVGELVWDPKVYYAPQHLWLRPRDDGVRIGCDDLLRRLLRPEARIDLPEVGHTLGRGDPLLTIACAEHEVTLTSPLAGTVTAVNTAGRNGSELVREHPYGEGWLVTVEAERLPEDELVHGDAVRAWMMAERERLGEVLARMLAATGASRTELIEEGAGLLSPQRWEDACHAFLTEARR